MRSITRRALCLLALASVPVVAAAGCSDDEGAAGASTATSVVVAPLPLAAHVVGPGELAGFTPPARPAALDLAAISEDNDVSIAELRRRGVLRVAKAELTGPPQAFAISAVAELETPEQAIAEAARLLAVNGSSEEGLTATPIEVPGIPGARGARKVGRQGGKDYAAFEVVWTDGALAHELFVLGLAADVRERDVLAAVAAVYGRTAAAPLSDG